MGFRWFWKDQTNSFLGRIVSHPLFDAGCASVICCNAIFIGYQSQDAIDKLYTKNPEPLQICEYFFFAFYSVELILKLITYRLNFFTNDERLWNIFDGILVIAAAYDVSLSLQEKDHSDMNVTWMRLLRMLKMLKMLRMVRVMRFFRELRLMLYSIIGSARSLFWSLIMLLLILYIFGLAFLQAANAYIADTPEADIPTETRQALEEYWGSLRAAMTTLFEAITGGLDWEELAEPLKATGMMYYALFLFYIAFLTFAVLNVLTGIFVDAAMSVAQKDRDSVISEELGQSQEYTDGMRRVLSEVDTNNSGYIYWKEFANHIDHPDVQRFLSVLDIDHMEVRMLFDALGDGGTSAIRIEDFVDGCTKIKGIAKSVDLYILTYYTNRSMAQMGMFMQEIQDRFNKLPELERWYKPPGNNLSPAPPISEGSAEGNAQPPDPQWSSAPKFRI